MLTDTHIHGSGSGELTSRCHTCDTPVLGDSLRCHGCGRPMLPLPVLLLSSSASDKRFYASAASRRRVRSMAMLSSILGG